MPATVDIHVKPTAALTASDFDEIWAVTDQYVETDRAIYEQKLKTLPEVGLWRAPSGELVGLVGLDVRRTTWQGRESVIIFTSSVVIAESYRGQNLVARTGRRMVLREKRRRPWLPAYWMFDTFSYKSYLIMARNFAVYWPRRDRPTPPDVAAFVDHLARERYGDDWLPERGIVRRSGHKRLRPAAAPVDGGAAADSDVQFFADANPGHAEGDMLVCLVPLSMWNLAAALGRSMLRRRFSRTR